MEIEGNFEDDYDEFEAEEARSSIAHSSSTESGTLDQPSWYQFYDIATDEDDDKVITEAVCRICSRSFRKPRGSTLESHLSKHPEIQTQMTSVYEVDQPVEVTEEAGLLPDFMDTDLSLSSDTGRKLEWIWSYFERAKVGKVVSAICKFCNKKVSARPTRLHHHMQNCRASPAVPVPPVEVELEEDPALPPTEFDELEEDGSIVNPQTTNDVYDLHNIGVDSTGDSAWDFFNAVRDSTSKIISAICMICKQPVSPRGTRLRDHLLKFHACAIDDDGTSNPNESIRGDEDAGEDEDQGTGSQASSLLALQPKPWVWKCFITTTSVSKRGKVMRSECKLCKETVSSRVARLRHHLERCHATDSEFSRLERLQDTAEASSISHHHMIPEIQMGSRTSSPPPISQAGRGKSRIWQYFSTEHEEGTNRIIGATCMLCQMKVSPARQRLAHHMATEHPSDEDDQSAVQAGEEGLLPVESLQNFNNKKIETENNQKIKKSEFSKKEKAGRKKDWAWDYFIPTSEESAKAKCKFCSELVSARHVRLAGHLETKHSQSLDSPAPSVSGDVDARTSENSAMNKNAPSPPVQVKIESDRSLKDNNLSDQDDDFGDEDTKTELTGNNSSASFGMSKDFGSDTGTLNLETPTSVSLSPHKALGTPSKTISEDSSEPGAAKRRKLELESEVLSGIEEKCIFCEESVTDLAESPEISPNWNKSCSESMCQLLNLDENFAPFFRSSKFCTPCREMVLNVDFSVNMLAKMKTSLMNSRSSIETLLREKYGKVCRSMNSKVPRPSSIIKHSEDVKKVYEAVFFRRDNKTIPGVTDTEYLGYPELPRRSVSLKGGVLPLKTAEDKYDRGSESDPDFEPLDEKHTSEKEVPVLKPEAPILRSKTARLSRKVKLKLNRRALKNKNKTPPSAHSVELKRKLQIYLKSKQSTKFTKSTRKKTLSKKSSKQPKNKRKRLMCTVGVCKASFHEQRWLDIHIRHVHDGDKTPFHCDKCDQKFSNATCFKYHKNLHDQRAGGKMPQSGIASTKCGYCTKIFKSEDLAQHKKLHESKVSERVPFACVLCEEVLLNSIDLQRHVQLEHEESLPKLKCEVCANIFRNEANLKRHIQNIHPDPKDNDAMKCTLCRHYIAKDERDLARHIAIHNKIQQHMCDQCGKTFTSATKLRLHLRIHTGERPYQCRECKKSFRLSHLLKSHEETHLSVKAYPCKRCGKTFRAWKNLLQHQSYHCGSSGNGSNKKPGSTKQKRLIPEAQESISESESAGSIQIQITEPASSNIPPVSNQQQIPFLQPSYPGAPYQAFLDLHSFL